MLEEGGREGWNTVDNCKGWINNRGAVEGGLGHKRKYNRVWWMMEHGKEESDERAQLRGMEHGGSTSRDERDGT